MGTFVSLHGRAYGIESETGVPVVHGDTNGVTSLSTASVIPARGTTVLGSSAAKDYTMAGPIPGVTKKLVYGVSSTGSHTVTLVSGTFFSTAGSSQNKATLASTGQSLTLEGLSTSKYMVTANLGSVTLATA